MFYLISYLLKKPDDTNKVSDQGSKNDAITHGSMDIEDGTAAKTAGASLNNSSPAEPPKSTFQQVVDFLVHMLDWMTLIVMLVFPSFTSYLVAFACAFGVGLFVFFLNAYRHQMGSVKIFPKLWEVGLILVNLALLIFEVVTKPSNYWAEHWTGLIVNAALLGLIIITVIIGKPFTYQFAQEKVPEEFWTSPHFMAINYTITYVWALQFLLDIMFGLLYIYVAPDNYSLHIYPSLAVLFMSLYFTSKYPEYARAQRKKLASQQQH